jgi:biotin carboxyl carrier protein
MALTTGSGVRITIGDRTWDVEEGSDPGQLAVTGRGAGLLRTPDTDGPRRVLWADDPRRAPSSGADHAGANDAALEIVVDGWRFEVSIEDLQRARLRERARRGAVAVAAHGPLVVRAPIPGRIVSVRVSEGDAVESGTPLVTLEAMKMENVVRAPRAGTIGRVAVATDQTVELGDTLLELA